MNLFEIIPCTSVDLFSHVASRSRSFHNSSIHLATAYVLVRIYCFCLRGLIVVHDTWSRIPTILQKLLWNHSLAILCVFEVDSTPGTYYYISFYSNEIQFPHMCSDTCYHMPMLNCKAFEHTTFLRHRIECLVWVILNLWQF